LIQRLGILGGTFDPVHHGHLVAAAEAYHQLDLDLALFVPTGAPPHKQGQPLLPAAQRLRMLELAIAGRTRFSVSRVDMDRPGPCYTVDTLELLRAEWGPTPTFFFVEGADSLADILTWHQPQQLIELCHLAVVERPGVEIDVDRLAQRLPGLESHLHWIQMPLLEISSRDLRNRVRTGQSISYLVPRAVEAYIMEHGLYRS